MITGLVRPDRGAIELDGYDVTPLPMYRRARLGVGYLPQEPSIFRGLSVEDNIRAVLEITQPIATSAKPNSKPCSTSSTSSGCARPRRSRCPAASGAAAKSPARSPATPPSCCSTSPSPGSIPIAVGDIQDLVRHLRDRGIGVLITDHAVRETLGLIDRAYIIHSGHVLTSGTPEEIVADPDVRRLYLGEDFRM